MGMRQTFNILGIKYENIESVNEYIKEYIKEVEVDECNCNMPIDDKGYPTIGARNIMACIGNTHCIKGNINTKELATKVENLIFPSHYQLQVVLMTVVRLTSKILG